MVINPTYAADYPLPIVEDMLLHIPPDIAYPNWLKVLMALKDWDPKAGLTLAKAWSTGELAGVLSGKYKDGDVDERWPGFSGDVTFATLIMYAREHEWIHPLISDARLQRRLRAILHEERDEESDLFLLSRCINTDAERMTLNLLYMFGQQDGQPPFYELSAANAILVRTSDGMYTHLDTQDGMKHLITLIEDVRAQAKEQMEAAVELYLEHPANDDPMAVRATAKDLAACIAMIERGWPERYNFYRAFASALPGYLNHFGGVPFADDSQVKHAGYARLTDGRIMSFQEADADKRIVRPPAGEVWMLPRYSFPAWWASVEEPQDVPPFLEQWIPLLKRIGYSLHGPGREIMVSHGEVSGVGKSSVVMALTKATNDAFHYEAKAKLISGQSREGSFDFRDDVLAENYLMAIDESGKAVEITAGTLNSMSQEKLGSINTKYDRARNARRRANVLLITGENLSIDFDAQGVASRLPHVWTAPDDEMPAEDRAWLFSDAGQRALVWYLLQGTYTGDDGTSEATAKAAADLQKNAQDNIPGTLTALFTSGTRDDFVTTKALRDAFEDAGLELPKTTALKTLLQRYFPNAESDRKSVDGHQQWGYFGIRHNVEGSFS